MSAMCVTRLGTYAIALCFFSGCGRADRAAAPAESHADHQAPSAPAPRVDAAVRINTTAAPGAAPKGMVWVPGGAFLMGSNEFYPEERPVHTARIGGFWMDEHPVTVAEFRRFIKSKSAASGWIKRPSRMLISIDS